MSERKLNFSPSSPLLYLIATPIGNIKEFSPRAIEIIEQTDYVAAEDTRNSGQLLKQFGITKPFISLHEHNEEKASAKVVSLLLDGKSVVYMSDAGYPLISDPGARLVHHCLENGIKVSCVSGPCATLNALVCSGLPADHFYFHGFLSPKENERQKELEKLKSKTETLIFYESPHRIKKTLSALLEVFGDRQACIARELTKVHEEFIRDKLSFLAQLDEKTLIGEMVIVVAGAFSFEIIIDKSKIIDALKEKIDNGWSGKEAVNEVSKELGAAKNLVYSLFLANFR